MNRIQFTLCILVALLVSVGERPAQAQGRFSRSRNATRAAQDYINNRPTVSPYLNLTSRDSTSGMPNYFTMVRPQVEQREAAVAQQRQTAHLQAEMNQVRAQVSASQQNAASMMVTGQMGWSARGYPRFGTYMSFYPGFQQIAR